MTDVQIIHGDCIEEMRRLANDSIDAIVTDPPYGLGFMGKKWDALPPGPEFAAEALRVLKPGGHMLSFGGTRTWHRLACAVEDAGFEIRDSIAWLYGSGFPKSLDVAKAIDKAGGASPEVQARTLRTARERWQGWGTALKPAFEPVVVARKPLAGTVAANVLEHGTGALNIDGARIGSEQRVNPAAGNKPGGAAYNMSTAGMPADAEAREATGRWPANVILDESQAAALDEQSGYQKDGVAVTRNRKESFEASAYQVVDASGEDKGYGGGGGASRFFYCAKAPKRERPEANGVKHPTVKPVSLMRWLVRLVTPPGGVVLDPFAGSGATVEAAVLEGFDVVAIEREAEYLLLIDVRLSRLAREETP